MTPDDQKAAECVAAFKPLADAAEKCPECRRPKARNADDCLAGHCPKWYAIEDREAMIDCDRVVYGMKPASMSADAAEKVREKRTE